MKEELQQQLFEKYPKLFAQRLWTGDRTRMCDGITCGDGWFQILDELAGKIDKMDLKTEATQVKEKFGGLRFYVQDGNEAVHAAIRKAEEQSEITCENCGKPARTTEGRLEAIGWTNIGWLWTVCSEECKEKLRGN